MRTFNFDESDESVQRQVESFFDEPNQQEAYMGMMQAGLEQKAIKLELLRSALEIAKGTFWWRFRTAKSKIKLVLTIHNTLAQIL